MRLVCICERGPFVELTQIGVARTEYTERAGTPQQALLNPAEEARVEVLPDYVEGLAELDEFDFVWLITWLGDDAMGRPLSEVPHMVAHLGHTVGSFATRGPYRPTPLGLHLVELVSVEGGNVTFKGVDLVDGTPVLDIKPYVDTFDSPGRPTRSGWYEMADLENVAKRRGRLS